MSIRDNRLTALVVVAAIVVAAAFIVCVGPAHIVMTAGGLGHDVCAVGAHTASIGIADLPGTSSASALLVAALSTALAFGATSLFAIRFELSRLVQDFATSDPLHGRLLI
jgi:hypothetical protein